MAKPKTTKAQEEYVITYRIPEQTGHYIVMANSFEDAKAQFIKAPFTTLFNHAEGDDPEIDAVSNVDTGEQITPDETVLLTGMVLR